MRHSTQGRSPFLVRLACVRHAASVHSEPESNSPVTYNYRATSLLIKPYLAFYMLQLAIYLSKILGPRPRGFRLYRLHPPPPSRPSKLPHLHSYAKVGLTPYPRPLPRSTTFFSRLPHRREARPMRECPVRESPVRESPEGKVP